MIGLVGRLVAGDWLANYLASSRRKAEGRLAGNALAAVVSHVTTSTK